MNYSSYENLLALLPQLAAKVGTSIIPWQENTLYSQGQILLYNNTLYKVDIAFTSSSSFDDTNLTSISGSSSFEDWQASTSYTSGQKIVYEGQIYEVTTDFTSSSTFDDTNLTKYVPNELTAQDLQDIADAFNPSGSGGGAIIDTLWEGTNADCVGGATLTLSAPYDDYDLIVIQWGNTGISSVCVPKVSSVMDVSYNSDSAGYKYIFGIGFSGTTATIQYCTKGTSVSSSSECIIVGIKFYSGGSSYATTEKKIGKWIDNSDIYQITFTGQAAAGDNTVEIDISSYNIKNIISIDGMVGLDSGVEFPVNSDNFNCLRGYNSTLSNPRIYLFNTGGTFTANDGKYAITIKYTKSS